MRPCASWTETGTVRVASRDGARRERVRVGACHWIETQEAEPGTTYNYMLGIGHQGSEILVGPLTIRGAPDFLPLSQNMPNPFSHWATIDYQLPTNSHVSIKIYDVAGRHVRTLRDREELAGFYSLTWDRKDESGRDVANGVYFYRLETPLRTETKKMIVLR